MAINKAVIRYPKKIIKGAVEQFQTPFFLYEEKIIRKNCQNFKQSFGKYFKNFTPLYAVKANSNPHIVKIIMDQGFGLDCSSPLEIWLAKKLNAFGMHTGNYSTVKEIQEVLNLKNILLNLDDISMLNVFKQLKTPNFLSFRINPNITKGGTKSLLFAGKNAKFGIPWENALQAYKQAKEIGVNRFGIHMMTGSNILDQSYFAQITKKLLSVVVKIQNKLGIKFEYINIGGGFGVPYKPEENTLNLNNVACGLRKIFDDFAKHYPKREPRLMVEPGRKIMADAGFLVTTVNVIKDSYKKFIGVDAGMNNLPRPAIYNAYHHISVLGKNLESNTETVNVVGRLCENNDQFAKDRKLPKIDIGDILVIHNAGAHCYSMGHNYNGRERCDEYLFTCNGKFKHIRRAETIKDLYQTILNFKFS